MHAERPRLALELDSVIFSLQGFGGISQYWQEISSRMRLRPEFTLSLCQAPAWQRLLRLRSDARVFHSSYFRVARGRGLRNVVTVHDMAFERGLAGSGLRSRVARLERRTAYFAADALVCGSEHARLDLLAHFPTLASRPITVIHHGPTLSASDPAAAPEALAIDLTRPYVLFVGGRQHYKNFDGALHGFASSGLAQQGLHLVCTGSPFSADEQAAIHRLGLSKQVLGTGPLDRASLVTLYRHAHCLLYASKFEGFGMPVLEAMTLGCPVVASECTSIPEVAGDAALLVPDGEAEGFARALVSLSDPALRQRLVADGLRRAQGFSWERSADQHAQVYLSLA